MKRPVEDDLLERLLLVLLRLELSEELRLERELETSEELEDDLLEEEDDVTELLEGREELRDEELTELLVELGDEELTELLVELGDDELTELPVELRLELETDELVDDTLLEELLPVPAHAPSVSPCARCAPSALRLMDIVCVPVPV